MVMMYVRVKIAFKLRRSKTRIEHNKAVSMDLTYSTEQKVFIKLAVCVLYAS